MKIEFKDYFSERSGEYSQFRPQYPKELFVYLSSVTQCHERAWDCATGNGQSALALSDYYSNVIGTDASKSQIEKAVRKEGITYSVGSAEKTDIESNSIDLITVAQALHWFNATAFAKEADRVLKPKGVLAVWTYNLLNVNPDINEVINRLYHSVLLPYWPPERQMVEDGYKGIDLPFQKILPPTFEMRTEWKLSHLIGYLCTWSAVGQYIECTGVNPVESQYEKLSNLWGDPDRKLLVKWPLTVKVWLNDT